MKISSTRTTAIIATIILLLAGIVVFLVYRDSPMPPGWTTYERKSIRVGLAPGKGGGRVSENGTRAYRHSLTSGGVVMISDFDVSREQARVPEDVMLDSYAEIVSQESNAMNEPRIEKIRF